MQIFVNNSESSDNVYHVVIGSEFTLKCEAKSNKKNDNYNIEMYHNGRKVANGKYTYKVNPITMEHNGAYYCNATINKNVHMHSFSQLSKDIHIIGKLFFIIARILTICYLDYSVNQVYLTKKVAVASAVEISTFVPQ